MFSCSIHYSSSAAHIYYLRVVLVLFERQVQTSIEQLLELGLELLLGALGQLGWVALTGVVLEDGEDVAGDVGGGQGVEEGLAGGSHHEEDMEDEDKKKRGLRLDIGKTHSCQNNFQRNARGFHLKLF